MGRKGIMESEGVGGGKREIERRKVGQKKDIVEGQRGSGRARKIFEKNVKGRWDYKGK